MKITLRIALGLAVIGLAGQSAFAATAYTNTIALKGFRAIMN